MSTSGTPTPTPVTQPETSIVDDAAKLGTDVQGAVAAAKPEIEKTAEDVAAAAKPVIADAHAILDDIKGATNQAQVHDLVEKLRAWIKANL